MDVSAVFDSCSRGQLGLATREQLTRAGLGPAALAAALDAGELTRVRRRVYARHPLPQVGAHLLSGGRVDPGYLQHAKAVLLELGAATALRARSAAVLWGLDMLVEPPVVEVQVARTQTRVRRSDVDARRTTAPTQLVGGFRVTGLAATLRAFAQERPLIESVAIVDSALRGGRQPRASGALRRAVALADPRAGSVLESALRVLLAMHGLPPPRTQYVIRDGGAFVARVDFCWPSAGLIVEADGHRWHDPQDVRAFDRRRANACARLGWRLLRFTWAEVLHQPAYVVDTVRAALMIRVAAA